MAENFFSVVKNRVQLVCSLNPDYVSPREKEIFMEWSFPSTPGLGRGCYGLYTHSLNRGSVPCLEDTEPHPLRRDQWKTQQTLITDGGGAGDFLPAGARLHFYYPLLDALPFLNLFLQPDDIKRLRLTQVDHSRLLDPASAAQ
jgi:hypothetical protein